MDVFIADGQDGTCEALQQLVAELDRVVVVGVASDAYGAIDGFLARAQQHRPPRVLILNFQLADGNGLGVLQFIRRHYPATRIVMLCDGDAAFYRSSNAGRAADDYFDKADDFPAILDLLRRMAQEETNADYGRTV